MKRIWHKLHTFKPLYNKSPEPPREHLQAGTRLLWGPVTGRDFSQN